MLESRLSRVQAYELSENQGRNSSANMAMGDFIAKRFNRPDILKGALAVSAINATIGGLALSSSPGALAAVTGFTFKELDIGIDEHHHVAPGYKAEILMRWGDPVSSRCRSLQCYEPER